MGQPIDKEEFTPEDFDRYHKKMLNQLDELDQVLNDKTFGQGPMMFGAEVEFSLVDETCGPAFINEQVIDKLQDDDWQTELNRFNLEYNFAPLKMAGKPFSTLEAEILAQFQNVNEKASTLNAQAVMTGILPTLTFEDLDETCMTDVPRYRALSRGIKDMRQGPFKININGDEPLERQSEHLTLEGANTSIQFHIQVKPQDFASWYNAIQIATPIANAISGNSPIFLEHMLWDETRIAVFKQAVESRKDDIDKHWRQPNRVSFGYGWIRHGAKEYFSELVSLYQSIFPIMTESKSVYPPKLDELRLHAGSTWRWNRGIYDATHDGHLRIEMRALPTGPTVKDMVANGAFLIGLASSLKREINNLLPAFPFMFAEYNFYRAAQKGFDASLLWPKEGGLSPLEAKTAVLAKKLLPLAYEGLTALSIDEHECQTWLKIIEDRIKYQKTGSRWMRTELQRLDQGDRAKALKEMLNNYMKKMVTNQPVATW